MQVKLFSGSHENVERAINRWADDGNARQIAAIQGLPAKDGEVTVLIVYNPQLPGGLKVPDMKINGVN